MSAVALTFVFSLTTSVAALEDAYEDAWLRNEREAVMQLFTDDAVLMPSRLKPVQGAVSMRCFWWPDDGSTTTVNSFETTLDGTRHAGDVAWAWGRGHLVFTWVKADGSSSVHAAESVFTLIARRDERGEWKMTHRMWTDTRQQTLGPDASLPGGSLIHRARAFRSLIEKRQRNAALAFTTPEFRQSWKTPWAAWDEHFRSQRDVSGWRQAGQTAIVTVRETNDYYQLLERPPVTNEITYVFDAEGKIERITIRGVGERPPGKTEEFRRWATVHAPRELEALMPEGEIDPSEPERFRRLLERWRAARSRESSSEVPNAGAADGKHGAVRQPD